MSRPRPIQLFTTKQITTFDSVICALSRGSSRDKQNRGKGERGGDKNSTHWRLCEEVQETKVSNVASKKIPCIIYIQESCLHIWIGEYSTHEFYNQCMYPKSILKTHAIAFQFLRFLGPGCACKKFFVLEPRCEGCGISQWHQRKGTYLITSFTNPLKRILAYKLQEQYIQMDFKNM